MTEQIEPSRRRFLGQVGRVAGGAAVMGGVSLEATAQPAAPGDWDLSWIAKLASGTDRAVFDWPSLGSDSSDSIVLQIAQRYVENCAAVYAPGTYALRLVLNIRTQAVPAAMSDALWARYQLGAEYGVKDHATKEAAVRNPYLYRPVSEYPGVVYPTLTDLLDAGAVILVCDFALGHLARRLASKGHGTAEEVHASLRAGFVRNAYAVPSGIFGLARAQNAGCAFVRM